MRLLWLSALRATARRPWLALLPLVGVALGVAAVVAVDLARRSAERSFELAHDSVVGRATHQIVGGSDGVDESVYVDLRVRAGIRDIAPVVEGDVRIGDDPVRLLGVDPLAEGPFRPYFARAPGGGTTNLVDWLTQPGAVLATPRLAARLGWSRGDRVPARVGATEHELYVAGVLEPQAEDGRWTEVELLIADIASAQEILRELGRLSRIDARIPAGPTGEALRAALERALPPQVLLLPASRSVENAREMTRAFRTNLTALGLLTLLVGAFLIYNALLFSVVSRRAEFGRLRALGVTRRQILWVVLGEAALLGALGSVLGLSGGVVLGRGVIAQVTQTINDLYFAVHARDVSVSPTSLWLGALLGMGATLGAALGPALEATNAPPQRALARSELEQRRRRRVPALAVSGVAALIAAGAGLALSERSLVASLSSLFVGVVGFALLTPALSLAGAAIARPPLRLVGGPIGAMAARGVSASLSRTGVAIAALCVALSAVVGVSAMVDSFRKSMLDWLDGALFADLFASALQGDSWRPQLLSSDDVARVRALPGVASTSTNSFRLVESPLGEVRLASTSIERAHFASFQLIDGDPEAAWAAFDARGAAIASETFAHRHGLATGDRVELLTPSGMRPFAIAGIARDYAGDQGVLRISQRTLRRHWPDGGAMSVAIELEPGASVDAIAERVRQALGHVEGLRVTSNTTIREASLEVFDRTFAVTRALRIIAVAVAFVGVLAAMLALALDRERELGVLRAVGLLPGQLRTLIHVQTALMGLIAGVLSLPLGVGLAMALTLVINKRSFGWTLDFHLDPMLLAQAVGLSVVAALLAGLYPAARMARATPGAVREE